MSPPPPAPAQGQPREFAAGVLLAGTAFLLWGFVPPYWHLVDHVPSLQVIAHRVAWTCALTALLLTVTGRWDAVRAVLRSRKTSLTLLGTGVLVTVNWGIFIYAVLTNQLVAVSMGYFINPLVNVLLGILFLRERLRLWQGVSVALAFAGVAFMAISHGGLPWISLGVAFSFGFYGLLRKTVSADPMTGTFVESLFVSPVAVAYLAVLGCRGTGAFIAGGPGTSLVLAGAGPVTAIPLLAFAGGARRIPLSMVGFLQYLTPTAHLLIGVLLYGETFTRQHALSFGLIWLGIITFTVATTLARLRRPSP
ncbi:MAG: EamA family transporter RarD [Spirochaetales bacterium]|nr:EamA family transporter RarD [Spirochaetales bacterium]